jgi:hypothetical protein
MTAERLREVLRAVRAEHAALYEIVDALAYEDRYQAETGEGSMAYLARLQDRALDLLGDLDAAQAAAGEPAPATPAPQAALVPAQAHRPQAAVERSHEWGWGPGRWPGPLTSKPAPPLRGSEPSADVLGGPRPHGWLAFTCPDCGGRYRYTYAGGTLTSAERLPAETEEE